MSNWRWWSDADGDGMVQMCKTPYCAEDLLFRGEGREGRGTWPTHDGNDLYLGIFNFLSCCSPLSSWTLAAYLRALALLWSTPPPFLSPLSRGISQNDGRRRRAKCSFTLNGKEFHKSEFKKTNKFVLAKKNSKREYSGLNFYNLDPTRISFFVPIPSGGCFFH
jgi:hypothetical protein